MTATLEARLREGRAAGRKLLVPYVTGGVTADWAGYLSAYQAAGADAIEIGLPFSDPMLDGDTVQEASDRALRRGTTVTTILADLARVRAAITVPLIAMTYTNLLVRRGYAPFCEALRGAGIGGLIVPDMPVDEAAELAGVAAAAGIDLVLLAAPSTGPRRLREIGERSRGFVYAVSAMAPTGERAELAGTASTLVAAVKASSDRPVLLGFGISTATGAVEASRVADGVVIGSALMRRVLDGATPAEVGAVLAGVRRDLDADPIRSVNDTAGPA